MARPLIYLQFYIKFRFRISATFIKIIMQKYHISALSSYSVFYVSRLFIMNNNSRTPQRIVLKRLPVPPFLVEEPSFYPLWWVCFYLMFYDHLSAHSLLAKLGCPSRVERGNCSPTPIGLSNFCYFSDFVWIPADWSRTPQ